MSTSISLNKAKDLLQIMYRIRITDTNDDVIRAALNSTEAIDYYTGDRNAYIFTKDQLSNLINQISNDGAVVFFEASREDPSSIPTHSGQATLIAFPYDLTANGLELIEKDPDNESGEEHPPIAMVDLDDLNSTGIPTLITNQKPMV